MRFYEYETWKLKEGVNIEEYDQMLRDWFQFLHDHKGGNYSRNGSALNIIKRRI